jgi:hypothetical protein
MGIMDTPKPPQKASARSRFYASIQGSVNQLATGGSDGACWSTQTVMPCLKTRLLLVSSTPLTCFAGKMQEILGMQMQGCDTQSAVSILGQAVLKSARIIGYASDFPFAVCVHISWFLDKLWALRDFVVGVLNATPEDMRNRTLILFFDGYDVLVNGNPRTLVKRLPTGDTLVGKRALSRNEDGRSSPRHATPF